MLRIFGHVGAWAGLYALAAFVCMAQLSGLTIAYLPDWKAMAAVFLTVSAVYALDRVKLRDAWLDPADLAAQPERFAFLFRNSRLVRASAAVMLVAAGSAGLFVSPWAPVAVMLSAGGVVAYAAGPRNDRSRIKDVLGLKNAYVAVGMTAFVLAVALASSGVLRKPMHELRPRILAVSIAAGILAARIGLDAAMCDIDDEPTDRRFGTATWATALGRAELWKWTGRFRVILVAALLVSVPLPWRARAAWAGAMALGMAALRLPRWLHLRDPVDLRFPAEALIATLCLFVWHYV